jgi:lysophospholipase L1-like esterase
MKVGFRLAAVAIGLLLAVLVAELGLRISGLGFGNSPMEPDAFLHHVHPKNYTFVQQHPSGELGGSRVDYNDEGRVVRTGGDKPFLSAEAPGAKAEGLSEDGRGCRIALMGDSFTEAGQVPFPESFAGRLEDLAGDTCEVRNYGVRSYAPSIYLVQYTRELRKWKPTHVFVLLFGNDLREDVTYMATSAKDADGFPTAIHGPGGGWLESRLRELYVARFVRMVTQRLAWAWQHRGEAHSLVGGVVEENPDWIELSANLVLELNRRVRADGAQLVVMAVPSRYQLMGDGKIPVTGDFHEKVKAWTSANGVAFVDLREAFQRESRPDHPLFFLQDIHFTRQGHAVVAAEIAKAFPEIFNR